ncbi:MAG TPA: carboxypeptidase regulatory-like domain-containing protein [Bryobacteraceae bacterium]|nr:carboxypeptidase regulatory-like domain-containing protein [Bryobacteraceae bacterium]
MKLRLLVPAFLLLAAAQSYAQFEATVLGTVTDKSGSAVPRAAITLLNIQTGVSEKGTTGENGTYQFVSVAVGRYRVTVQAAGFKTATTEEFSADVGARQRVDVRLEVGELNQTIDVRAAAAALETDSSNRGQVIEHHTIVDLPLNGREYADLALLAPGVRKAVQSNTATRDGAYDVNGMRSAFNSYNLDGLDNNAYGTSNQGFSYQVVQASPDAVQEFRFDTNNYSAEFGRAAGAVINASIRSGTNELHGSVWEFLRNTQLNAVGFFQPVGGQKPTLVQNQFGAAVGGPVRRNKLFFFTDYEGFRSAAHSLSYSTLPTAPQKQGNLGTAIVNPLTGASYQNGIVPVDQITPFAAKVLSALPDPNLPGAANNYQSSPDTITPSDKGDARIDYYLKQNLTFFGRFSTRLQNQIVNAAISGPSGGDPDLFRSYDRSIALGSTWTLGAKTVMNFRLGLTRMEGADFKASELNNTQGMFTIYGIPGTPETKPIASGLNTQSITGYSSFGHNSGQHQYPEVINPKADYSRVEGRHTIKAGVEYQHIATEILDLNPLTGKDTYTGQFSRPAGAKSNNIYNFADFLFGARDSYNMNSYGLFHYLQQMYFGYVQDDFRATHNLTFNIGLRYEFATPQYEAYNHLSNFNPATNNLILAKGGSLYDRALVNPDPLNFAPRFGFAYSLNSKTVIRSAYGISYEHFNRSGRENLLAYNGPYVVNELVNQTPSQPLCTGDQYLGCFRPTMLGYPAGFTASANFNTSTTNIHYTPSNTKSTYVQSWHLTVQRELSRDLTLDVGYVGNHGTHVYQLGDYNQAVPNLPGQSLSLAARRPVQNFSEIETSFNESNSSYNSLQAKLEKRFSSGISLLNSFAWSKALDIAPSNMETGNGSNYYMNFRNWRSAWAISDYDLPFQNTTSFVWDTPIGKGRRFGSGMSAVADAFLGGWRLAGINTAISGQPINFTYTPSTAGSVAGSNLPMRPNVVGNPFLPTGERTPQVYFNIAAFAVPDISQPFGSAGRNIGRSDGIYTFDLAIDKSFVIRPERQRLQFRAEAFNVLNKTNFQAAASNISTSTFGTITKTFPARQIQLALKYTF